MPIARIIQVTLIAVATFIVAAGVGYWRYLENARNQVDGSLIGGPFTLMDQTGAQVTEAAFAGKLMLIYFGYSFCPDVCPTELAHIAQAVDLLGDDAGRVVPVFITVDPERDTPEVLAGYVGLFHPAMVGLTGSVEEISAVARSYRVFYEKVESEAYTDYLMSHSSFIYLQSPEQGNLAIFPHGTTAQEMADGTAPFLSEL